MKETDTVAPLACVEVWVSSPLRICAAGVPLTAPSTPSPTTATSQLPPRVEAPVVMSRRKLALVPADISVGPTIATVGAAAPLWQSLQLPAPGAPERPETPPPKP